MSAERVRKKPREKGRCHAVDIGRPDTEGDEGEHVRAAVDKGLPPTLEERPASPQHYRGRQKKLEPGHGARRDEVPDESAGNHVRHREEQHRRGQGHAYPEPPRHVPKLEVFLSFERDGSRLQRHAADRARAGSAAHDLGMHRAGVLRLGRAPPRNHRLQRHAAHRAGSWSVLANLRMHGTGERRPLWHLLGRGQVARVHVSAPILVNGACGDPLGVEWA